jgi:aminopeptidase N
VDGERAWARAVGRALADQSIGPAFKALLLQPPAEQDLALVMCPADPEALHQARDALMLAAAEELRAELEQLHEELDSAEAFSPDADSAGRRALRNAALEVLAKAATPRDSARAAQHFETAGNMTDSMAALTALSAIGGDASEAALSVFYAKWRHEPLVVDKWFAVQARSPAPDTLGRVIGLTAHPAFDLKTPNRMRALIQVFSQMNPARFHDPSGAGYRFLADQILAVDRVNPNTAARLVEPLGGWRRYRPELGALMRKELERVLETPGVSRNVVELASKALEA